MSQQPTAGTSRSAGELKTTAHVMMLEPGTYTVSRMQGGQAIDRDSGLPDIRVSRAPEGSHQGTVEVVGFRPDGWIRDGAALVRIAGSASPILITIYQRPGASEPAPRIQVQQIVGAGGTEAASPVPARVAARAEVAAHVQRRGDVVGGFADWIGDPGSQRWIEGFSLAPKGIAATDIEYQAVLGRGWLSPWSDSGQYCGSRGMALPILGLRIRLKGAAATTHTLRVDASFTDGTKVGPVGAGDTCEAESLAPLEAFKVELVPAAVAGAGVAPPDAGASSAAVVGKPPSSRGRARAVPESKPVSKPSPKSAASGRRR